MKHIAKLHIGYYVSDLYVYVYVRSLQANYDTTKSTVAYDYTFDYVKINSLEGLAKLQ